MESKLGGSIKVATGAIKQYWPFIVFFGFLVALYFFRYFFGFDEDTPVNRRLSILLYYIKNTFVLVLAFSLPPLRKIIFDSFTAQKYLFTFSSRLKLVAGIILCALLPAFIGYFFFHFYLIPDLSKVYWQYIPEEFLRNYFILPYDYVRINITVGHILPLKMGWSWLAYFDVIVGSVLVAVSEEIVFRAVLRNFIERFTRNIFLIVVISSTVFAAIHWVPNILAFNRVFYAFLFGIGMMILYIRTGSLVPCIIAHYLASISPSIIRNFGGS